MSRILRNKTYMGMIGYRKSTVNNYLEKKRINNLNEDNIEYVKGDFEPIISEELWTKCESIRKGKITKFRMPNGEERRKGTQSPRLLWVTKIRCRCGGAYKRFCWRTLANGIKVFGYQCVVRTQNPSRQFVIENSMEQTNYCNAISIQEWKLELMVKMIFDRFWGDQKEAVLKACVMIENAQKGMTGNNEERRRSLNEKIEKFKKRKKNFSIMYADGDLTRDEYKEMVAQLDKEIEKLESELNGAPGIGEARKEMNVVHIKKHWKNLWIYRHRRLQTTLLIVSLKLLHRLKTILIAGSLTLVKRSREMKDRICAILEPRQSSLLPLHSIRQRHTERPTKCLHNSERQHGQI